MNLGLAHFVHHPLVGLEYGILGGVKRVRIILGDVIKIDIWKGKKRPAEHFGCVQHPNQIYIKQRKISI